MLAEAFDYSTFKHIVAHRLNKTLKLSTGFFLSGLGGDKSLVVPILRAQLTAGVVGGEVYLAEQEGVGIVGATV